MIRYPFDPDRLDVYPEEITEIYRALENDLLEEICSRFKIAGEANQITIENIRVLRSHGISMETIEKAIKARTGMATVQIRKILDDAVARNQKYYTKLIDLAGLTQPRSLVSKRDIDAIRRQTEGELKNLTRSMGFVVTVGGKKRLLPPGKAYQHYLDLAVVKVQSGAFSYNQAIASAIKELAGRGSCVAYDKKGRLRRNFVQYESGWINRLDVAARRAVMSGVNSLCSKYRDQSTDYLNTDLVEVTAHLGARNTGIGPANHESWHGRVYRWSEKPRTSKGDYDDFVKVTGYGSGEGLLGWNCRHSFFPYIEGISEPVYSKEQLEKMKAENGKFTYEGKEFDRYSATQQQRKIETEIRKQKRLQAGYKAAGLTTEASAAASRISALNAEYKAFSKAAGLPEQRERMKVLYTEE